MGLIDAGGARMRELEGWEWTEKRLTTTLPPKVAVAEPSVRVLVSETHDGEACDCIDKEMVLKVGSEIELEHVCHDGRVDKVIARVLSIDVPVSIEHGRVKDSS